MMQTELNGPQMAVAIAVKEGKNKIYFEGGRGVGKSTVIGYIIKELCKQMPRACFTLVGETYMQMLSVTLKSTKEGLEMFDIYEDIDYVVGRSGKKNGFAMPHQRPDIWKNIIHFSNGCIIQMVSLDRPNSGRGMNSSAEIGDEAALLDPERLFVNVSISNRAGRKRYPKASLLNGEFYFSTTPLTKRGRWFTDMEEKAKENPDKYLFIKANAHANAHNLPVDYFEKMREKAPSILYYKAEILNIRVTEVLQGFYAQLQPDKHYYRDWSTDTDPLDLTTEAQKNTYFDCRKDNDCIPDEELILSLDFGTFNSLTVQQHNGNEHRFLKEFFVDNPKILEDLFIEQFLPYYKPHKRKRILLYYGHDGNSRQANSTKTMAQEVEEILHENGWKVKRMSKGAAPGHLEKYMVINTILKETNPDLPQIRINEANCSNLIISMENAEAKDNGTTGLKKDKSSERSDVIKQQHATHLSDTFDFAVYDMYYQTALQSRKEQDYMPISIRR